MFYEVIAIDKKKMEEEASYFVISSNVAFTESILFAIHRLRGVDISKVNNFKVLAW